MAKFVHLHVHTEYSLLDGISKIKKLVKKAKDLGMEALAITDHGSMYGAIEFYKACKSEEIKPIIGCEMYIAPRSYKSKEGKVDADPFHLTVLAKNFQGYQNLMKLVSMSHLEGFYYKPRIDKELLKQYKEGLIVLSGCPGGEFLRALDNGGIEKAEEVAKTYADIMGEGNYYFELQNHNYRKYITPEMDPRIRADLEKMALLQEKTFEVVKTLSQKMNIPAVAAADLHYVEKADAEAQDAVICVQTGKLVSDIERMRMGDAPELYLKSAEEMAENFKDFPEAIENTLKIADQINLEIDLVKAIFPKFIPPDNKSSDIYLRELTYSGAEKKLEITEDIRKRLDYELDIICNKQLEGYFLVVSDFIEWAHGKGIITNTRGSAAGSLVLYCLGVTNLNPLDYLLPFERFLTKDRPYMPDIDADLADDRRDEVIHYLMDKYGADKVAHIVTFGTMQGRAAIRDIGRVLGLSYTDVDRVAKLVPPPKQGFHTTLEEHLKQVPELIEIYKSNPQFKKLLDLACQVEGTVRHASVHAAGILITPEPMTHYTPIQKESNGDKTVSQYDMYSVVDEYGGLGLVKMDLLGIRNLSILGRAIEYVKNNRGIEVDLNNLPLDDKKTYELLGRGETMGIFQMSSSGMTKWLMELKPTKITDLSAMVALYRPGPMGSIPEYIERANDPRKVKYLDPRMESYMSQSLGLLVYQEDLLYTATNIAGYPWDKADKFRKAVGKKKPELLAAEKDPFIKGCVENGMTKEKAEQLFELIVPFAAYGFGKAHAASYGMVSYQTAYMKANFPAEFMAAVMTAEHGDTEKISEAMSECKKIGITVLPPDVNYSYVGFTLEEITNDSSETRQGIRFGLSAIKNVGISAIESIIVARNDKPFTSMGDLCSRVDNRLVNKKTLESLIKAGAMDTFGSRAAQLVVLDQCLEEVHRRQKSTSHGQTSLFGDEEEITSINITLPDIEEMPLAEILTFERDLLGFYLHEPPYLKRLVEIKDYTSLKLSQVTDEHIGGKFTLGGVIMEIKKVVTKKSAQEMAFIRVFDGVTEMSAVVFPKLFAEKKYQINKEDVVLIQGKIDKREDEFNIVIDDIEIFDSETAVRTSLESVEIELPENFDGDLLKKVNNTLRQFPGVTPISILMPKGDTFKKMALTFSVNPDLEMIQNIEQLLGSGAVRINS